MPGQDQLDLRKFALEAAFKEHAELWDAWKVIEAKAQPLSATTGVFLAALFAYAASLKDATWLEMAMTVLLALLLLCSTLWALWAIRVVDAPSPHLGTGVAVEIDQILANTHPPNSLLDRHVNLINDTATRWLETCELLREELGRKQRSFNRSLACLAAATVVAMLLILSIACFKQPTQQSMASASASATP